PPLSTPQKLAYEKELLGLYISDHPFKLYQGLIPGTTSLSALHTPGPKKESIRVAGIITLLKKIVTKTGKPMLFATIEDSTGAIELVVFPSVIDATPHLWQEQT